MRRGSVLVFCLSFLWLISDASDSAIVKDEGEYFRAALILRDWLRLIPAGEITRAFSAAGIAQAWDFNHEHPPIVKLASAFGLLFFSGPPFSVLAFRLGPIVLAAAAVALAWSAVARGYGRRVAGLMVACLMTMPTVLGHARIVTMDFAVAMWIFLAAVYFLQGFKRSAAALMFGIVLGLGMATKINAWIAPVPLVAWAALYRRRRVRHNLVSLLVVAPCLLFASWPWLWHDPGVRLVEFMGFHRTHAWFPEYYFGRVYAGGGSSEQMSRLPWHFPFAMFLFTIPVPILAAGAYGAYVLMKSRLRRAIGAYWVMNLAFPMLVPALGLAPAYDGPRLFLPAFPFLALLAGIGASSLGRAVGRHYRWSYGRAAVALVVVLPAAYASVVSGPYRAYGYYNLLAGGRSGAHRLGLESNNWGAVGLEVPAYLNEAAGRGDVIYSSTGATGPLFTYQTLLGRLRPDLRFGEQPDWIVLEVNESWSQWYRWWTLYEDRDAQYRLVKRFDVDGVPVVLVFRLRDELRSAGVRPRV